MYEHKTGPGHAYIICDVCGRKIQQKDAVLITDKYNTQYGLLVCKHDVDKLNPQNIPFHFRELTVQDPKLLRSEQTDHNAINLNDDRVPSAPQLLSATLHPINNSIILQWQGPQDAGSGPIIGYVITRAYPQLSYQFIIESDTNSTATYYEDIGVDTTSAYTYTVAAISTFGTGVYSEVAYFPNIQIDATLGLTTYYLLASDTNYTILSGDESVILAENI